MTSILQRCLNITFGHFQQHKDVSRNILFSAALFILCSVHTALFILPKQGDVSMCDNHYSIIKSILNDFLTIYPIFNYTRTTVVLHQASWNTLPNCSNTSSDAESWEYWFVLLKMANLVFKVSLQNGDSAWLWCANDTNEWFSKGLFIPLNSQRYFCAEEKS